MVQELRALFVLFLLQLLHTGLLDSLGTGLCLLLIDVGIDELKMAIVPGDPGGGRGSHVVGVARSGGAVEDEGSVAVDGGFPDAVASTASTMVVSAS